MMFQSINPYDQSRIEEYPADDNQKVNAKIRSASEAFSVWKRESFSQRSSLMQQCGENLHKNRDQYALIISTEMGKLLTEAKAEVDKCANACFYYAEHAEYFLNDQIIETEAARSFITYQPLGIVLAIMPWNFPFWQVFRFAIPSIMAGNVALLKHAANVSLCSLTIQKIFTESGFADGVFQSLLIESKDVERVIERDEIAAVTLTGSELAGTKVASAAGRSLKKTVLELGGSDPFIVLEDADLEQAAKIATQSRMQNAGQSCIAAKRFIVVEKVKNSFMDLFKKNIELIRQGNPLEEKVTMGPVARLDLAEDLENQLSRSLKAGAKLITGGKRAGCNFQPTLLDHVAPGNPAFDEEIFGPIASIVHVKDEAEAILMANKSRYGLGGSVWTCDLQRGERVAREVESGCVFVNSLMRSDQRLPFGGIKKSGYGRELSELGIKEFVNAKTIYVA